MANLLVHLYVSTFTLKNTYQIIWQENLQSTVCTRFALKGSKMMHFCLKVSCACQLPQASYKLLIFKLLMCDLDTSPSHISDNCKETIKVSRIITRISA